MLIDLIMLSNTKMQISRLFSYFMLYIRFMIMSIFNNTLRLMGYVRVYDIQNGSDLTFMYYLLKNVNKLGPGSGIGIDITYPKLGVCRYVDSRYTRYICYDSKILDIDHISTNFSAKNYHDIKKIEIITKTKNTEEITSELDVTKSKTNFFDSSHFAEISRRNHKKDINDSNDPNTMKSQGMILDSTDKTPMRFTEIFDVIKFYQTVNYPHEIIDTNLEEDRTIRVTREKFDDDLLEFITTCEEVQLK